MDTRCCLCTNMLLCSFASRPVNFWLSFASHSMRHVCMLVLEQCYGHDHQWYKLLLSHDTMKSFKPNSVVRLAISCYGTDWVSHQKFINNTLFKEFFSLCWSQVHLLSCSTPGYTGWIIHKNHIRPGIYCICKVKEMVLWCWRTNGKPQPGTS